MTHHRPGIGKRHHEVDDIGAGLRIPAVTSVFSGDIDGVGMCKDRDVFISLPYQHAPHFPQIRSLRCKAGNGNKKNKADDYNSQRFSHLNRFWPV